MQDYLPVQWNSEPISLEKIQQMIQNDQTVADELATRPKGIIGYSELTMYAANVKSTGYKAFPSLSLWANSYNNIDKIKEWTRVTDNWNINPNGLSVSVNTESNRLIHVELYIPLLAHGNAAASATTAQASQWPIQGFKFVRDGIDISAESLVDTWAARGDPGDPSGTPNFTSYSLSTSSFYFDCFDINPGSGSHTYEVMWKSDSGLRLEIWDQMRNTYDAEPSSTFEPDQDRFLYHVIFGTDAVLDNNDMTGRYNISDFVLFPNQPQKYTTVENGATVSTGDSYYTPNQMWGAASALDAPFAGSLPTAQLIITDCGSSNAMLLYKEDEVVIQEAINADPTA